jgi:hypothetical protein
MNLDACVVERRCDGAVIVRVASRNRGPDTLPDAVFSFRAGDPQYHYWEQILRIRESSPQMPAWLFEGI